MASRPFRLDFEPNPFEVSFQSPSTNQATNASTSPPNRSSQPPGATTTDASTKRSNASASPIKKRSSDEVPEAPGSGPGSSSNRAESSGAADPVSGTADQSNHPSKKPSTQNQDKNPETPARAGHGGNSGSVSSNTSGSGAGSTSGNLSASNSTGSKSLPGITALTSPSDGNNPFNWVTSSLRDGPLSPAMLGAPSTSNQGFDVSAFRTGLTPDLSNFKTGFTPLGPGMSLPPTSPNTAAFLSMVSSNGAANLHSGSVNAQGMLSISAPPNYGGAPATLTPNTLTALSNVANAANSNNNNNNNNDNQSNSNAGTDYFSHRPSTMDRPGSRLRNSMTINPESNESGQPTSVSPDMMESKPPTSRPGSHSFAPAAQAPYSHGGKSNSVDHSAASGLYLLSQAHHELSKREGNVAAAEAAAQALKGVSRSTEPPAQAQGNNNARGNKRKKSSPQLTSQPSANETNDGNDDTSSRPGSKARGKGRPAGSKKSRTDSNTSNKRGSGKKSSPIMDEDEVSDDSSSKMPTGGTEEEKRKSFLERNRQAALKCRQRKKAWLQSLQQTVEVLRRENESLTSTVDVLQQEVVYLRSQLLQSNGAPNVPGQPPSAQPPNAQATPHPSQSPTAHHYLPHPQLGRDMFPPRGTGLPPPSHAGPGYPYGGMPPPPPPGGFGQGLPGVDGKKIDVQ